MGLTDAIFNRGGFGRTITRAETIERVNPLLEQHARLNHAYAYAIGHLSDPQLVEHLKLEQKTARTDVGKLRETVLSAGGVSYSGTDLEAKDFDLGREDDEILRRLHDEEERFQDKLVAEGDINHQMRTRAIVAVVAKNSRRRLDLLKALTKGRRRPAHRT